LRLDPYAVPPRDKDVNAELVARARASQAQYVLPRMWAPTNRRYRRRLKSKQGRRLIGKAEVIARVGLTYQAIWRLMNENRFPRSVALAGKVYWYEDEVDEFIDSLPRKVLKSDKRQAVVRMVNRVTQRRRIQSNQTEETTT